MSTPHLLRHDAILGPWRRYPAGSVERAKSLGIELWSSSKTMSATLALSAAQLARLDEEKPWQALGLASPEEYLESVLGQARGEIDELLATIRSKLSPAVKSPATPARVVNLRHEELGDAVYVGRAMPRRGLAGSDFANPYRVDVDGSRADVIQKYRSWLLGRQELLVRLHELRGRRLACWCSPEPCHADVLRELVDADEVLDALEAAGVAVAVREGRLRLSPASAVDAALQARVAAHRDGILSLLATRPDAATLWRQAVEAVAESLRLPPDVLEAARAARARWIPASRLKDR